MKKKTYRPKVGKHDSLIELKTRSWTSEDPPKTGETDSRSVEDCIAVYEAWAGDVLRDAGLPGDVSAMSLVNDKPLTQAWYAAKVLGYACLTRHAIENADARQAVMTSMTMMERYHQAQFRQHYERDILINQARENESKISKRKPMDAFKAEYRATRDAPENEGFTRVGIIDLIDMNFTLSQSRMYALAKEADKEDSVTREKGRPRKRHS